MPDGGGVRARPAPLGDGQGEQGQAAPGCQAGGVVLRLARRRRPELLTFVTRQGCTLCAEALPVVQRLAGKAGVPVEVRDVDDPATTSPEDRARWSDHVPVVLLDGEQHSMWFVDERALGRALRGR